MKTRVWPVRDLAFTGGQPPELLFVVPEACGDCLECGGECGDLVGEDGEGAAGRCAVAVLLDGGPDRGVPEKSGGPGRYGRQRR